MTWRDHIVLVIEGLMIVRTPENSSCALPSVSPWGSKYLQLFLFRRGHPASTALPCVAFPLQANARTPTRSPSSLPAPLGPMWDRMPGAVLTAPWAVSHNSITVTPASPPPLPNSDPTGPAPTHLSRPPTCAQLCGENKNKKYQKNPKQNKGIKGQQQQISPIVNQLFGIVAADVARRWA